MDVEQSASWDRNHTNIRRTFSMPSAIFSRNIISDSPIKEMTSSEWVSGSMARMSGHVPWGNALPPCLVSYLVYLRIWHGFYYLCIHVENICLKINFHSKGHPIIQLAQTDTLMWFRSAKMRYQPEYNFWLRIKTVNGPYVLDGEVAIVTNEGVPWCKLSDTKVDTCLHYGKVRASFETTVTTLCNNKNVKCFVYRSVYPFSRNHLL